MVTLADREHAFERDNIHVGEPLVAHIVDTVLAHYAPDMTFKPARLALPKSRRAGAADKHYDLFAQAKHFLAEDRPDQALAACQEAFVKFYEVMPDRDKATAHATHASALMRLERWPEAAVELEKAVGFAPSSGPTWFRLGRALALSGRRKEAAAAYERALQLDPKDEDARRQLNALRGPLGPIQPMLRRLRKAWTSKPAPEPADTPS
jgi:tetratricopeptide (TPR) repeat protein